MSIPVFRGYNFLFWFGFFKETEKRDSQSEISRHNEVLCWGTFLTDINDRVEVGNKKKFEYTGPKVRNLEVFCRGVLVVAEGTTVCTKKRLEWMS